MFFLTILYIKIIFIEIVKKLGCLFLFFAVPVPLCVIFKIFFLVFNSSFLEVSFVHLRKILHTNTHT
jgi:hypothetical protein